MNKGTGSVSELENDPVSRLPVDPDLEQGSGLAKFPHPVDFSMASPNAVLS
jgi:hypothetical protein